MFSLGRVEKSFMHTFEPDMVDTSDLENTGAHISRPIYIYVFGEKNFLCKQVKKLTRASYDHI